MPQLAGRRNALALLQKVGTGYRFIHALLLDYLADRAPHHLPRSK
jgi:hypothetical protein